MLTNVIAYLHTTLAYQSAAMQLMVGQANFDAQQLHLREALPIVVPADTNQWNVAMPPDGVTGNLATSNYIYRFVAGKLTSIQMKDLRHGVADAPSSVIDTNGAYQLARQWLTALSVDVPTLESRSPPVIRFTAAPMANNANRSRPVTDVRSTNGVSRRASPNNPGLVRRPRGTNEMAAAASRQRPPIFRINWGGGRGTKELPNPPLQISMEILGSTRECLSLRIVNPALLKAPPLQVSNAATLLGSPPPPQHYVEELLGGKAAYNTVAQPERVLIWLIGASPDTPEVTTNRTQALVLDGASAATFSRAFTDFNSYSWLDEKSCTPDYGVRLRFSKGAEIVDFAWCYNCDHLQVTHNGRVAEKDCDAARVALIRAVQSIFPKDDVVKGLTLVNPNK